jgi:hypothetical protein
MVGGLKNDRRSLPYRQPFWFQGKERDQGDIRMTINLTRNESEKQVFRYTRKDAIVLIPAVTQAEADRTFVLQYGVLCHGS